MVLQGRLSYKRKPEDSILMQGVIMKEEVETGVRFISRLINRHDKLAKGQVQRFGESLATVLCERFNEHWYPENPLKGQAYRCIRINRWQKVDDSLLKACTDCGLDYSELALPREVSIWIDPGEVCCRLGENNHYFKVKNEERSNGKASPELETSDYHSESPSECSSEDEGSAKAAAVAPAAPSKNRPAGSSSTKQAPQYFYMPSPLWVPCPQPLVSYIPAYPPVAVYYLASKTPARRKPNPNLVKRLTNRASKV